MLATILAAIGIGNLMANNDSNMAGAQTTAAKSSLFPGGDEPDVVLMCHTYNEISVEAGEADKTGHRPSHLSQASLKKFLKPKKHKDHIVIWLEKSIDWESPSEADKLSVFESFAVKLGYKRTIILGCRAFSMPVIFDSGKGGHQKPEDRTEPAIIIPMPPVGR